MKSKFKALPYYPLLFAMSPVLSLYARNTSQVTLQDAGLSLGLVLGITAAVYALALALSRDGKRAALVALVFVVLFFLYGTISHGLRELVATWVFPDDDRRILLAVWGLIFLVYSAYVLKTPRSLMGVTRFLNASSGALAVVLVGNIVYGYITQGWLYAERIPDQSPVAQTEIAAEMAQYPDIYYIILDGYARQDILANYYGYDNSAFIEELESMGFYVAHESRANYNQTLLSVASSLNMEYLAELIAKQQGDNRGRVSLAPFIADNAVAAFLHERGYTTVAFDTGYDYTRVRTADIFLQRTTNSSSSKRMIDVVIDMTAIAPIISYDPTAFWTEHQQRILYILETLATLPGDYSPQFVLAHIVCPHPPFVFTADGDSPTPTGASLNDGSHLVREGVLTQAAYRYGYVNQLQFVNKEILSVLRQILAESPHPPVIVLQSDHGPGSMLNHDDVSTTNVGERMSILNAFLLPDGHSARLYASITPVNSFRIILGEYFGREYSLASDTSYFAPWRRVSELTDVTERAIAEARRQ